MTAIDIRQLNADEKLELIEQLWESLSEDEVPLTQAQKDTLDARLATYQEDRAEAISWLTLKKQIRDSR